MLKNPGWDNEMNIYITEFLSQLKIVLIEHWDAKHWFSRFHKIINKFKSIVLAKLKFISRNLWTIKNNYSFTSISLCAKTEN